MSAVRMCDRCGAIFSENADGWQTYMATSRVMVDGRRTTQQVNADACPDCSRPVNEGNVTPRLAGRADPSHVAALEAELGIAGMP